MPRTPHHGRSLLAGGALAAVAGVVAAAAVTGSAPGAGGSGGGTDIGRIAPAGFSSFTSCDDLLSYFRTNGRRLVTAYGLPGQVAFAYDAAGRLAEGAPAVAPGALGAGSGGTPVSGAGVDASKSTTSATGTNVQVAGVDEADMLKVDGDRLLTLTDGTLRILRIEKDHVRLLGSLRLANWAPQSMLVDGDRLLLLGGWSGYAMPMEGGVATGKAVPGGTLGIAPGENGVQLPDAPQGRMTSRLAEVSLADSSAPKVVRVLDVDGSVAGARMVDGVVRLAVTSTGGSRIAWTYPQAAGDESRSLAANRSRVTRSTIDDWLPEYSVVDVAANGSPRGAAQTGRLLDCGDVAAPTTFSGLDMLSLLTLDLRGNGPGLSRWNGTGVVATGSTMYATADHTYVATSPWQSWAAMSPQTMREAIGRQMTQIHLFDTTDTGAPRYVASGDVPGFLIGQFAMDEYQGRLRVASTTQPSFGVPIPVDVAPNAGVSSDGVAAPDAVATGKLVPPVEQTPSSSQVTVLSVKGTKLLATGSVTGLGRGETIRAVRFIGPLGYVVTYRQTDPLYVVDLRNPARPTVRGELKILGYSAYLHPVGDGLLLGLGQDADANGRTRGMQMSLFDVSDPANPRRLDRVGVPGAWSDAEGDHHAFTFADGLALAPYTGWGQVVASAPAPAPAPEKPLSDGSGSTGAGSTGSASGSTGSGSGGGSAGSVGPATPPGPIYQIFDSGVLAVRVAGDSLDAPRMLRPLSDGPLRIDVTQGTERYTDVLSAIPLRTLVRDGVVFTLTPRGIAAHNASTGDRIGFTHF